MENKKYTVKEVCLMFGCSENSVRRWIKNGDIKAEFEQVSPCIQRAWIYETEFDWIKNHKKAGRPDGTKGSPWINRKKTAPKNAPKN